MFGLTNINAALNVAAITNLLTTYMTGKALFDSTIIPQDLAIDATSINFYLVAPTNNADYSEYNVSINCRSGSYAGSLTLAYTVHEALHRHSSSDGGYFLKMSVLPTISPADNTDNFNTPIEAIIKER